MNNIFLHAGNSFSIPMLDIVGIFDTDTATQNEITREYLRKAEREDRSEMIIEELPKSFIVTAKNEVYYSQVAVATLKKRTDGLE